MHHAEFIKDEFYRCQLSLHFTTSFRSPPFVALGSLPGFILRIAHSTPKGCYDRRGGICSMGGVGFLGRHLLAISKRNFSGSDPDSKIRPPLGLLSASHSRNHSSSQSVKNSLRSWWSLRGLRFFPSKREKLWPRPC